MKNLRLTFTFVALLLLSVLVVAFNTPVHPASAQLPSGSYKWVAITKQDWVPLVQPLADVRTAKGLPAYVASVEWIYANFPGADKPEQIRNFMKQAYENWGVQYLLIAGDILAVPTYYVYEQNYRLSSSEFYANHRPTDWYYGYFDKPEVVAVGRLPAVNATDLQVMIQKTVSYETNPPEGDWRRTAIYAYGFLRDGTNGTYREEEVCRDLSGFNQIEYAIDDRVVNCQAVDENFVSMINSGASILYVSAHGIFLSAGTLNIETAQALRNGLKLPIVFAHSCGTAMFDITLEAQYVPPDTRYVFATFLPLELLRNPLGGCVSYVGYVGLGGPFPMNWFFRDYRLGTMIATTMLSSNTLPDIAILGDPALQWVGANQYGSSITLQVPSRIEVSVGVVATGRVDPPVAGVQIEGGTFQRIEGQSSLSSYGSYPTATTNADGTFQCTFPELRVGRYVLWVWWRGGGGRVGACSQFIEVEVVPEPTSTPLPPQTPRCVIATATYGSELAAEVSYMRYVRDGLIGSSDIGKTLAGAWNAFYYSWSPPIAQVMAGSPTLQTVFRTLLLPLVGIVHVAAQVFNAVAPVNADLASAVAFAFSAFMCIMVYVAMPLKTFLAILKKFRASHSSLSQTIRLEARCR